MKAVSSTVLSQSQLTVEKFLFVLLLVFIPRFQAAVIPFDYGNKEDLCPLPTNVVKETMRALARVVGTTGDSLSKVVDYLRLSENELVKLLEEVGSRSGKSFTVLHIVEVNSCRTCCVVVCRDNHNEYLPTDELRVYKRLCKYMTSNEKCTLI